MAGCVVGLPEAPEEAGIWYDARGAGYHIDIRNAEEQPIACGIMMDRDALHEVGLYNSSLVTGEDVDLEHRFTERYRILRVPIPLYRYRVHPDNTTKVAI